MQKCKLVSDGTEHIRCSQISNKKLFYLQLHSHEYAFSGYNWYFLHALASLHHFVRIFPRAASRNPASLPSVHSQLQSPALYKSSASDRNMQFLWHMNLHVANLRWKEITLNHKRPCKQKYNMPLVIHTLSNPKVSLGNPHFGAASM